MRSATRIGIRDIVADRDVVCGPLPSFLEHRNGRHTISPSRDAVERVHEMGLVARLRALECVQQPYSRHRVGLLLLHPAATSSEWTLPGLAAIEIQRRSGIGPDAAS